VHYQFDPVQTAKASVDDLVEGMLRKMESEAGFTGPVNLGNPSEFTMLELAETVIQLLGAKSKLVHRPLP